MERRTRRLVSAVFATALMLGIAGLVVIVLAPVPLATPYTELYVLNESGVAADYQTNLSVGETGTVIVGVENHEHESVEYTLAVVANGSELEWREFSVSDGGEWREEVSFAFDSAGRRVLRFELYRGGVSEEPYRLATVQVSVE